MSDEYDKPFDLLDDLVGNTVEIVRHDSSVVIGTLQTFDRHTNMALTDATVYPDGADAQHHTDIGRLFQRGGAVTDLRPADVEGDAQ